MPDRITLLRRLLRVLSFVCLLAVVPMVMPTTWIGASHQAMGLGVFPAAPIALYLARCTSALSAFYGGLLWVLAGDPARFRDVILYQAVAMLVLSLFSVAVGLHANLPLSWLLVDLIGCWAFCLPIALLAQKISA